jgi:hypothetical protein
LRQGRVVEGLATAVAPHQPIACLTINAPLVDVKIALTGSDSSGPSQSVAAAEPTLA